MAAQKTGAKKARSSRRSTAGRNKKTARGTGVQERTARAAANVRAALRRTLGRAKTGKKYTLTASDRKALRQALQELRDRVVDEINFLAGDNLIRSQRDSSGDLSSYSFHMADQGTDSFDREFALNLVSNEQEVLYEIDEALQRLDAGTYGQCEMCEQPIEKARLEALPFARLCIKCQSATEKARSRIRPASGTFRVEPESSSR